MNVNEKYKQTSEIEKLSDEVNSIVLDCDLKDILNEPNVENQKKILLLGGYLEMKRYQNNDSISSGLRNILIHSLENIDHKYPQNWTDIFRMILDRVPVGKKKYVLELAKKCLIDTYSSIINDDNAKDLIFCNYFVRYLDICREHFYLLSDEKKIIMDKMPICNLVKDYLIENFDIKDGLRRNKLRNIMVNDFGEEFWNQYFVGYEIDKPIRSEKVKDFINNTEIRAENLIRKFLNLIEGHERFCEFEDQLSDRHENIGKVLHQLKSKDLKLRSVDTSNTINNVKKIIREMPQILKFMQALREQFKEIKMMAIKNGKLVNTGFETMTEILDIGFLVEDNAFLEQMNIWVKENE